MNLQVSECDCCVFRLMLPPKLRLLKQCLLLFPKPKQHQLLLQQHLMLLLLQLLQHNRNHYGNCRPRCALGCYCCYSVKGSWCKNKHWSYILILCLASEFCASAVAIASTAGAGDCSVPGNMGLPRWRQINQ